MNPVARILRRFIDKPTMATGAGRPIASFNKFQYWAYPELCRAQLREALSQCDEKTRDVQLRIAKMYFGPAIAIA